MGTTSASTSTRPSTPRRLAPLIRQIGNSSYRSARISRVHRRRSCAPRPLAYQNVLGYDPARQHPLKPNCDGKVFPLAFHEGSFIESFHRGRVGEDGDDQISNRPI